MGLGNFIPALCILFVIVSTSVKAEDEKCSCGLKNPNKIVNGVDAGENEYPMAVALLNAKKEVYCGGTIITDEHVLTASHCLDRGAKDILVKAGAHNIKEERYDETKDYEVKSVRQHPDYNEDTYENDIGILKMKKKFKLSMEVGIACLPLLYTQEKFVGEKVTVVGWGRMWYEGDVSDTLKKVDLDVVEEEKCKDAYEWIENRVLCTYTKNKDSCSGDSGGPVLWHNATSNNMILIGLVSFGNKCADEDPGINTLIANYLDFIKQNTNNYEFCAKY